MASTKAEMKQSILDLRNQIPKEEYEIAPGQTVWVYGLTGRELAEYRQHVRDPELMNATLATAKLIQMTFRDEHGHRIFGPKDVVQLAELPACITEQIREIADRLNGTGPSALEEVAKNLLKTLGVGGLSEQQESTDAASPSCSTDTQPTNSPNSTSPKEDTRPASPETQKGS